MKKLSIVALLASLCCVTACNTTEPTKLETPYLNTELGEILFTDVQKSLTVDISENEYLRELLQTVTYYDYEQTQADVPAVQVGYVITLQTMEIQICSDNVLRFVYEDESEEFAFVQNNEFAFCATTLGSGVVAFDGYSAEQKITVKNASKASAEELDNEALVEELSELRFVKLGNAEHYEIGDLLYTITIGTDEIVVYNNYVMKNGALYRIYEGNFDFLSDLKFSASSGWLPWL